MSLSNLLLSIFLILLGVTWLAWIVIDTKILGLLAFVTGLAILFESAYPIVYKRR